MSNLSDISLKKTARVAGLLYLLMGITSAYGLMYVPLCFLFLSLVLYSFLKQVNKTQSRLLLILVVASVPIAFFNTLNQIGALLVINGADYLKVFEPEKLYAIMMIFLDLYNNGIFIVGIFWGLWLFPFGYLVYKSEFLPRILGIFLIISCFGYLIDIFSFLFIPGYHGIISKFTVVPMCVGEFSIILWLLIKGVKTQK